MFIHLIKARYDDIRLYISSRNNNYNATLDNNDLICIYDSNTERKLHDLVVCDNNNNVTMVKFSPNSQYIAGGSKTGTIRVWDVNSGQQVCMINQPRNNIYLFDFSSDSMYIIINEAGCEQESHKINCDVVQPFSGLCIH